MFKKLYPTIYAESAYIVDFQKYYNKGFRALILDVDNTLVEHGAPADERAKEFFKKMREIGFRTCIISNNHEPRIKPFASIVGSPYIFDAGKPGTKGYLKAMEICNSTRENSIFMGDQLFTDVWGANRAGIPSILVKPIKNDTEIQIRLKRLAEKIVLPFYLRYQKKHPGDLKAPGEVL